MLSSIKHGEGGNKRYEDNRAGQEGRGKC
jgi:hypothetical protein